MIVVQDEVLIRAPLETVFGCFWEPALWTRITPHVRRIEMLDASAQRQRFLMTIETRGETHTMETQREAIPPTRISYRQSRPPAFLLRHSGTWTFSEEEEGVRVRLVHEAEIDASKLAMLHADTVEHAESMVARNLRANGNRTMVAVKEYLECASAG